MRSNWLQWDWSFPGVFFEKEFYLFRAVSLSIGSVASGHKPPAEASSAFETTGRETPIRMGPHYQLDYSGAFVGCRATTVAPMRFWN